MMVDLLPLQFNGPGEGGDGAGHVFRRVHLGGLSQDGNTAPVRNTIPVLS
jgi:hypothetical protein